VAAGLGWRLQRRRISACVRHSSHANGTSDCPHSLMRQETAAGLMQQREQVLQAPNSHPRMQRWCIQLRICSPKTSH
jgi:hypothetical protein